MIASQQAELARTHRLLLQDSLQADATLHVLTASARCQALVPCSALLHVVSTLRCVRGMQRMLAAHLRGNLASNSVYCHGEDNKLYFNISFKKRLGLWRLQCISGHCSGPVGAAQWQIRDMAIYCVCCTFVQDMWT